MRAAFSLVELLITIALIAVLAALATAGISSARESGKLVKCQGNLRQIAAGFAMFTADNDGVMPNSAYGGTTVPTNGMTAYKWMDVIYPYLNDHTLFLCPADEGADYQPAKLLAGGGTSTDYGSYGLNGAYRDAGDGQTPPRSAAAQVRVTQIVKPAQTVLIADTNNREEANGSFGFTWANASANPSIRDLPQRQLEKIIERHAHKANVLFCDGHAEAMRLEKLADTKSVVDPVDGSTKNVMTIFTIEGD